MATRQEGVSPHNHPVASKRSVTLPGIFLGLGLGGFADGILLHQVLQWHHLRTGDSTLGNRSMKTIGGLEANTLADGMFHVATWALTVIGLFWLWSIVRANDGMRSWFELIGLVLAGWGIFNLVEGLVDHHILGIHHVRDDIGAPLGWDLGFLAFGAVLVAVGFGLYRRHAIPKFARGRSMWDV